MFGSRINPLVSRFAGHQLRRNLPKDALFIASLISISAIIVVMLLMKPMPARFVFGYVSGHRYHNDRLMLVMGLGLLAIGVNILVPLIVSSSAAFLTVKVMRSEEFDLIRITTLSASTVVSGHILVSLYRTRHFLIFMTIFGLVPLTLMFAELTYQILIVGSIFIVSGWGFVVLGAAFGVRYALQNNYYEPPFIVAPIKLFMIGVLFLIGMSLCLSIGSPLYSALKILMLVLGALMPFLITIFVVKSSERWVRRADV